jgi:hypothetical protein
MEPYDRAEHPTKHHRHKVIPERTTGLHGWRAGVVQRRRMRKSRVRVTWRTCRRCGSYGYQAGKSGLYDGCRSL